MEDPNAPAGTGTANDAGTGTATSPNPSLDAPSNAPAANPPQVDEEPRIIAPIDEVQREVDERGNMVTTRSLASAAVMTKSGATGAPDGIGLGHEGAQGQEPPADTTAEAEDDEDDGEEGDTAAKRKSRKKS